MRNFKNLDINSKKGGYIAIKKPIPLEVHFAKEDGTVETKEGSQPCKAGDAIMTGTKGEHWPIPLADFNKTYEVVDKDKGLYAKKSMEVYAREMKKPFTVNVSWSDKPLVGKPGDRLVQYKPGDFGIVDKEIFGETYNIIRKNTLLLRFSQKYLRINNKKPNTFRKIAHLLRGK